MRFYEFGEDNEKTLLLVHGMATTWKMSFSSLIQEASKYYHLIVVALDGHNEEEKTEFISLEEEAKKIEEYLINKHCGKLHAGYGSSLGGTIVLQILANQKIEITKTILDSPYASDYGFLSSLATKIMTTLSMKMISGESKIMNKMMGIEGKESSKALIYTDISKETLENCFYTSYNYKLPEGISKVKSEIVFWYGSKESFPCKFAKRLMKQLSNMTVRVFEGYGHGELLKNTERLVLELSKFM
ncbi:MAG: alpha/beta fold hydrolase [Mobilitalea sp.]